MRTRSTSDATVTSRVLGELDCGGIAAEVLVAMGARWRRLDDELDRVAGEHEAGGCVDRRHRQRRGGLLAAARRNDGSETVALAGWWAARGGSRMSGSASAPSARRR